MEIRQISIIEQPISSAVLQEIANARWGDMVKAVVDIDRKIMALGGELHSDEEMMLLDRGSQQRNLWGVNIYPGQPRESWLEFDSMINIRPNHNNRTRGIDNSEIQKEIITIVNLLIAE
jgi:hypothetical protein